MCLVFSTWLWKMPYPVSIFATWTCSGSQNLSWQTMPDIGPSLTLGLTQNWQGIGFSTHRSEWHSGTIHLAFNIQKVPLSIFRPLIWWYVVQGAVICLEPTTLHAPQKRHWCVSGPWIFMGFLFHLLAHICISMTSDSLAPFCSKCSAWC